jgi:hypothetical protein
VTKHSKLHTGTICEGYKKVSKMLIFYKWVTYLPYVLVLFCKCIRIQSIIRPRQNVSPVLEAKLELPKIKILSFPKAILGVQRILFKAFFWDAMVISSLSSLRFSETSAHNYTRDGAIHDTSIIRWKQGNFRHNTLLLAAITDMLHL